MEFVLIKYKLAKKKYEAMTQSQLNRIVSFFSGHLMNVEEHDDVVILLISAPSTWRTLVLHELLIPYRYI